ncbi:hypothetical protein, partial [Cetobacterium sp.]|uniref:hypothetical protein n=1 Tax=Cetobacterium sp. TaxID=2071632 RepID=UPI003F410AE1
KDTEFYISDSEGRPINEIKFEHILTADAEANDTLVADIRATGAGLSNSNYAGSLSSSLIGDGTATLYNNSGIGDLASTLAATATGFDDKGAKFEVSSLLKGTPNSRGDYSTAKNKLTIIYTKTTTPETGVE